MATIVDSPFTTDSDGSHQHTFSDTGAYLVGGCLFIKAVACNG